MKTLCLAISVALGSAAAALHAQTTTAPDPTNVKVTGCIERASTQAPVGTSGTAGTPAADASFVLTTPSVDATVGTSGAAAAPRNVVYRLDDANQVKVSAHEGEKVEITGKVQRDAARSDESSAAAAGATRRAPTLKVESIRKLASGCSK